MVTLKKDMIHVYDRFEQETGERILNGSLKAGDCIISGKDAAAYCKISRRSARTAPPTLQSADVRMFCGRFWYADCKPVTAEILPVFRYFDLAKFPGRNYINVVLNNLCLCYVGRRQLRKEGMMTVRALIIASALLILCGCQSRIDHSSPRALVESYAYAFAAGEYEAMVEAWSPETRKMTRKFAAEHQVPERDFVKFMIALGGSAAKENAEKMTKDPEFLRQSVEEELSQLKIVTGRREEGLILIDGKWYLQFF